MLIVANCVRHRWAAEFEMPRRFLSNGILPNRCAQAGIGRPMFTCGLCLFWGRLNERRNDAGSYCCR